LLVMPYGLSCGAGQGGGDPRRAWDQTGTDVRRSSRLRWWLSPV